MYVMCCELLVLLMYTYVVTTIQYPVCVQKYPVKFSAYIELNHENGNTTQTTFI